MKSDAVDVVVESGVVVLIDPLVLDGLRPRLDVDVASRIKADPREILSLPGPMRVGVYRLDAFTPGVHRLSRADFQSVDGEETDDDPATVDVDSGALIAVDVIYLPRLAQVLTWERYDWYLRSPVGDNSRWDELVREVGVTFGLLNGDAESPFPGDGRYQLRPSALKPSNSPRNLAT